MRSSSISDDAEAADELGGNSANSAGGGPLGSPMHGATGISSNDPGSSSLGGQGGRSASANMSSSDNAVAIPIKASPFSDIGNALQWLVGNSKVWGLSHGFVSKRVISDVVVYLVY